MGFCAINLKSIRLYIYYYKLDEQFLGGFYRVLNRFGTGSRQNVPKYRADLCIFTYNHQPKLGLIPILLPLSQSP